MVCPISVCCFFIAKSLLDPFLIFGIISSPIFVYPFPVVVAVLPSVTLDVFLVLLTICSLVSDDPFLVSLLYL